jgi:hypothetical protein
MITMSVNDQEQQLREAVAGAWERHDLGTYRHAEDVTGVERTCLMRLREGPKPSRGKIIEWAQGIGENINHWLGLAGYDPIPIELLEEPPPGKKKYYIHFDDMDIAITYSGELTDEDIPAIMPAIEELKAAMDKASEEAESSKDTKRGSDNPRSPVKNTAC